MNSIFWHDYETTGTDPAIDRPLQFAGLRTDEALNPVDEPLTLYCKPSRDTLPNPVASLITGITPQDAERLGVAEPQFIAAIHQQLARPGTCGAGYNSIRFDDEVTRFCLYRNFFDPYQREWQNGNSRWDIIDMLRLTRALRPEGIVWPDHDDGSPSFRLEQLTAANGIDHEAAHDALSDVRATIALARLVKERQPRLYDYVFQHRLKRRVTALLDVRRRTPVLHVSARLPRENGYTALMMPLATHPQNRNAVIAFNLNADPEPLLELAPDELRQRLFTPGDQLPTGVERVALKGIHSNRCPVIATAKLLTPVIAERLGIDLQRCERHRQRLQFADLGDKLTAVFSNQPAGEDDIDVECALYRGFLADRDRPLLAAVRSASPDQLRSPGFEFSDGRYRELLFRYRARNFQESLDQRELQQWQAFRAQRLQQGVGGAPGIEQYRRELAALAADPALSPRDRAVVDALREWGKNIIAG